MKQTQIQPFEWQNKWLLAKNVRYVQSNAIDGTLDGSGRGKWVFDDCWSSQKGWIPNASLATAFCTKADAEKYIAENGAELRN